MEALMIILYLAVAVGAIVVGVFAAKAFEESAHEKGHYDRHYWAWCFWLPVIGYLMVIALPDLNQQRYLKEISEKMSATGISNNSGSNSTTRSTKPVEDELPEI